jgi:calcineurin-like phosphoesterase family protein
MNQDMLEKWNEKINRKDEVIYLGDWFMHPKYLVFLTKVNFGHMWFVRGNHDKLSKLTRFLEESGLNKKIEVVENKVFNLDGRDFYAVHRPIQARDEMPTVCGHVHEKWKVQEPGTEIKEHSRYGESPSKIIKHRVYNVGVDVHGMYPVESNEVLSVIFG